MRAATPVVRISAQSAADAAAGDGSAPREHVPQQRNSARDVSALPHSAPRRRRQTALNASCSVTSPNRPGRRIGAARRNTLGRAAVAASPFLSALVTAPYGTAHAFPHHMHRRYAGNAESARRLIACHAPLDKLARRGSRAAFHALRRSGSAPHRRWANAGLTEAEEDGRSAPAAFSHIFTPSSPVLPFFQPSIRPFIPSSIADTQGRPDDHVPACDVQPHNGAYAHLKTHPPLPLQVLLAATTQRGIAATREARDTANPLLPPKTGPGACTHGRDPACPQGPSVGVTSIGAGPKRGGMPVRCVREVFPQWRIIAPQLGGARTNVRTPRAHQRKGVT